MRLKLLPRYILTFGLLHGSVMFMQIEVLKNERIKIKGVASTISLRNKTPDVLVFHEVFLFKAYHFKRPAVKVIVDGGGNIGLTSIFLNMLYPDSIIYCIEPSINNFNVLLENTKPYPSIVPIHSALWNKDTHMVIENKDADEWAFTVKECSANAPDSCVAMTISTLMKKYHIEFIDILKLDIEGSERDVFGENYEYWIQRTKCILIELHDWIKPDCSKTVFKTLSQYNFKTSIINGMLLLTNSDLE